MDDNKISNFQDILQLCEKVSQELENNAKRTVGPEVLVNLDKKSSEERDFFRRRIILSSSSSLNCSPKTGVQFDFDKLNKEASEKVVKNIKNGSSNSRSKRFSTGEFSYSQLIAHQPSPF